MANPEKAAAVAELKAEFESSNGVVLTEYRGLTVKQLQQLRRSLGEDVSYAVAKNTLTKRAAKEAGVALDEDLLVGPSAVAFVKGDVVEAAKGLRDFAKTNPSLVIKGGVFEGRALDANEFHQIADLESREVLLSKLAGALNGSLAKAASMFQAPLSQVARAADALRQQQADGAPAESAAAEE